MARFVSKVDWITFAQCFLVPMTLCMGEEKCLTDEEVMKLNKAIATMASARRTMVDIFQLARQRWEASQLERMQKPAKR